MVHPSCATRNNDFATLVTFKKLTAPLARTINPTLHRPLHRRDTDKIPTLYRRGIFASNPC